MTTSNVRHTLLVLVLGLLLVACGANDTPVTTGSGGTTTSGSDVPVTTVPEPIPEGAAGLAVARERWDTFGLDGYSMTYRELCFCPETLVTVSVEGGQVVDAQVEQEDVPPPIVGLTVEGMFDEIQQAVDRDAAEIQATYDEATGRPTRYWIDPSTMMADEEHGIEVIGLVADVPTPTSPPSVPGGDEPPVVTSGTSQPPAVRSVAQAQLSEPWSCGWGFAAVDPSRTVALLLRPDAVPPVGSSTVTFPAPGWEVEVQLGTDLLAVKCSDLDFRRPPAPDETWPVVGGTLQISAPPLGGCGAESTAATALATDVTVEAPDGTTITFADLSLVNDQWGCLAG